ncbi:MAG: antitoxin [Thermoleophilia bacterium]|nr:antitoxin [Thermoleophilia bacterium]
MATETTTIRVPRETRDLLAQQAKQRGESLSAMLTKLAERETRDAIFKAERQAVVAEKNRSEVTEEAKDWEVATGDGFD